MRCVTGFLAATLVCLTFSSSPTALSAQQSMPPPQTMTSQPQLDAWRQAKSVTLMNDFGELSRYRAANLLLHPPIPGSPRVLFFGDSITDNWKLEVSFPEKHYVNRGIGGQTTSQMLVRFRQDVIDLQPHILLLLAGTNDIAGNTGPISVEDIERNYATLAELARFHHIVTIFASVTPVNGDVPARRELFTSRPASEIIALNTWLKDYCAANGDIYLDYYSAMVDARGQMNPALSDDGLHPNAAGYKVMAPLAQTAIDQASRM